MLLCVLDILASRWLDWRTEQNARRLAPEIAELGLKKITALPGGWEATFVTLAAAEIANDMAAMLDATHAENYVQFDMLPRLDRGRRPIRVTVQWAWGKSPAQRVAELEARIAELEATCGETQQ